MSMIAFLAEAGIGGAEAAEATLLGLSSEGWVYVSITIFFLIAIFYMKAHRQIAAGLDARIAETRRTLDEAAAIRAEAETLLAEARARQSASAGDAAAIISHAEAEAAALLTKAERDAKDLTARRQKMAEDKIAAAERAAEASVRAQAAMAAARAAETLIAAHHDAGRDAALVDDAIRGLGRAH